MTAHMDLPELLDSLDPSASLVQRDLWMINLIAWVRGDRSAVETSISRLTLLLDALQ